MFFENSKGDKLCGILSEKGKERAVILCHGRGFTTSKNSKKCTRLQELLNNGWISTFRFDFFGHGESGGRFEDITVSEAVDDILNAIKFLKQKGFKRIGLLGLSFGGMASIIAASQTDLYVLVLVSPVSDYLSKFISQSRYDAKKWKEDGFITYMNAEGKKLRVNYSFFEDAVKISGYDIAKKIRAPTLIVHGDGDESVPVEQSRKMAGLIENCKLEIIKGADHRFTKPEHLERVMDLVSRFIIEKS